VPGDRVSIVGRWISIRRLLRAVRFGVRNRARQIFALVLGCPLLRLAIGRWPSREETKAFISGFTHDAMLPPLLRGLAGVPSAREPLTRTMLASWMLSDESYRGRLRVGLDSNTVRGSGDVLRVWTGPPIGFIHIAKTGGSSAKEMLRQAFHPVQIAPEQEVWDAIVRKQQNPDLSVPAIWKYALIAGHFDYPEMRLVDRHRTLITFFREPDRRILSLYYYWRSFDRARIPSSEITPEIECAWSSPLLAFLRSEHPAVRSMIDNGYIRRLTGFLPSPGAVDRVTDDPEGALRLALTVMDDIAFVGVTERMAVSMATLARQLDVTAPADPVAVNVTEANESGPWARFRPVPREPVTDDIAAALSRLTRLDRVIYDAACARLDAALRPSPSPD